MNETTYNGWANYETWAVNLWIDNDEGSQRHWHTLAAEAWAAAEADSVLTRSERARYDLADQLKSEHEENVPELSGPYADLLNAALGEVNWDEIADSLLSAVEIEGYEPRA